MDTNKTKEQKVVVISSISEDDINSKIQEQRKENWCVVNISLSESTSLDGKPYQHTIILFEK